VFAKIDHIVVGLLKCWAFRHHSRKSHGWALEKYFKSENNRKWVFKVNVDVKGKYKTFTLNKLADIPITRHVKIMKDANPFDSQWVAYFVRRRQLSSKGRRA
jgi:RNA-directed DNA polymerase